jgi:pimeloyl-ACP methyl ester carboxylesterase
LAITERDERGLAEELTERGHGEYLPDYPPRGETCEVTVPPVAGGRQGVLSWLNPGPTGKLPRADWPEVLARHRLILVVPNNAGNDRHVSARLGLLLDCLKATEARHPVEPDRVFIGGFSGGAKSALRAMFLYPDVFRGALLAGGATYFHAVPALSDGRGRTWPAELSIPRDVALAKRYRFVFVSGTSDMNFGSVSDVVTQMKADGFHVDHIGGVHAHEPPSAGLLEEALALLER